MRCVVFLFLLFSVELLANDQVDSLNVVVAKQHGLEKVETLIKLHDQVCIADPYKAVEYLNDAINEAEVVDVGGVKSGLYNRIGNIYIKLGLNSLALDSYFKSMKNCEKVGDKGGVAYSYNDIGNVYFTQGDYKIPRDYYLNSIEIFKAIKCDLGLAVALNNLGLVALGEKKYDLALDYFSRAFELRKKKGQVGLMAHSNRYISDAYLAKKEFQKAVDYMQRSIDLYGQINEPHNMAKGYFLLGEAYLSHNKIDAAIIYYNKGLNLFKIYDDFLWQTITCTTLGSAYLEKRDYKQAIHYAQISLEKARRNELTNYQGDALKLLSDIYLVKGDQRKAFQYLESYNAIKDSLYEIANNESYRRLQFSVATYKDQKDNEILKVEVRKRSMERNYLLVIIVLAFGGLVIIYSWIRQKRYKEKLIYTQREEIATLEMAKKEHENIKLNRELEYRNKELTAKTMSIIKDGEFIGDVVNDLQSIEGNKEINKSIEKVIQKLKNNLKEDSWKEFELRFEKVYNDFYLKLNESFPDLTPNERKLCAFLRLNMSTKEISSITYQSAKSIDVARSRLRRKLKLSREENLINFLQQF